MFTGLIQAKGKIQAVQSAGQETRFGIKPDPAFENLVLGESIAVNGACLTVEEFSGNVFSVYASGETLSRTNLGKLKAGDTVNLERALAMGDRLGGHMVSGHVDCMSRVEKIRPAGESKIYRLSFPKEYGELVVPKGSVALDGISLTVNECGPDWLEVNIIPVTQDETSISGWRAGYEVNMETDIIGRYVQRMLGPYAGKKETGISRDFLAKHGF